jgi:predicted RecA/RadA family phage recombinase
MRNHVQEGSRLTLAAPYALTAGQGAKVGQIFGVAQSDAANGAEVRLDTQGVFDLTKVGSQAWTVGALVYWDDTNKRCTTTATGSLLIGVATAAVANGAGDTIGRVRLNGTFRANEA